MKTLFLFIAFISLVSFSVAAQTRKTAVGSAPKKRAPSAQTSAPAANSPATEIPAGEWGELVTAIEAENWNKSSQLALAALKKLKNDNEKKQLARARYFYIYSLTGKIAQKTMPPGELERISEAFVGQDFLMPSRQVRADCTEKVNYVCTVKADEKSLRVTATSKSATIHSFEYVKLSEKFDTSENDGKEVFLGGKLQKLEIGTYKNNVKIVKLYFENGSVDVVSKQN